MLELVSIEITGVDTFRPASSGFLFTFHSRWLKVDSDRMLALFSMFVRLIF